MTPLQIETRAQQLERQYEALLRQRMRESYQRIVADVATLTAKLPEISYSEAVKYERLSKLQHKINIELKDLSAEQARIINDAKYQLYKQQATDNTQRLLTQARSLKTGMPRIETSFVFLNKRKLLEAVASPMESIALRRNYNNILSDIESVITRGLIEGRSYNRMARELQQRANISYRKSLLILRTEGTKASTLGQLDAFDRVSSLGIGTVTLSWIAAMDERTRISHQHLNGQLRNEEEKGWWVPSIGQWVNGPGDPTAPIEFTANCRCRTNSEFAPPV